MNDNIVPFPPQNGLGDMKYGKKVAKRVAKGQKVTQSEAFGALVEMRELVDGVINAVGRVASAQTQFEGFLQGVDTALNVLMKMLKDKEVFTGEDWDNAWNKYVVQPQEEGLSKYIENLKEGSAEDAFFAEVLSMVREHEWPAREINGEQVEGQRVRDFYINMLANPATRRAALDDLRREIPEIPELNVPKPERDLEVVEDLPEEEEALSAPVEDRVMPDCKYCGVCEFCQSLDPEQPEEPDVF